MLNFGSIFRYQETFYIYLLQTEDTIYAAKILDREITKELLRKREVESRNPRKETHWKPVYCFVVLSTDEFSKQAAHYGFPQMQSNIEIEAIGVINSRDLQELKNEIIKDSAVPPFLRDKIKELFP